MTYAAFDRNKAWLFNFISDNEDLDEVLKEAQEEDASVASIEGEAEDHDDRDSNR